MLQKIKIKEEDGHIFDKILNILDEKSEMILDEKSEMILDEKSEMCYCKKCGVIVLFDRTKDINFLISSSYGTCDELIIKDIIE